MPCAGHFPCRTLIDEEEEKEAQHWADRYATAPCLEVRAPPFGQFAFVFCVIRCRSASSSSVYVQWTEDAQQYLNGGTLEADLLIIASSPAAGALLGHCLQSRAQVFDCCCSICIQSAEALLARYCLMALCKLNHGEMPSSTGTASVTGTLQVVGHLWQPEIMQEAPVALRAMVEGPTGRQTATQLLYDSHNRTSAALCHTVIPPERSAAWVEGLLSHVKPQHILFAASLPVGSFPHSMPHSLQWISILTWTKPPQQ